jgi:hypothetical protein
MAAPEVRHLVDRRHSARFQQPLHPTVLRPQTAYTGRAKYIVGEFGVGFTLVVAVLAAYFWTRRAEVAQARQAPWKPDF